MPLKNDWIYLAGIIDGEGCIRANNAPRVHVTNTDQRLTDWLVETFGGYVWHEGKSYMANAKPRHVWEVSARKAQTLLREVEPYLKLKQQQARLVLGFYETASPRDLQALRSNLGRLNKKGVAA